MRLQFRTTSRRSARLLLAGVRRALGPATDIATHVTPRYNPETVRLA